MTQIAERPDYDNGGVLAPGHRWWLQAEDSVQARILADVVVERRRQVAKWGPQTHPDLSADPLHAARRRARFATLAQNYKAVNDHREQSGDPGIWADIWLEEIYEALEEGDLQRLRKELIESIAVATAWLEDIDTREV